MRNGNGEGRVDAGLGRKDWRLAVEQSYASALRNCKERTIPVERLWLWGSELAVARHGPCSGHARHLHHASRLIDELELHRVDNFGDILLPALSPLFLVRPSGLELVDANGCACRKDLQAQRARALDRSNTWSHACARREQ